VSFSSPKPGDIVECLFPQDKVPRPGPKPRPALVLDVETFEDGTSDVVVAYGTSQDTMNRYPGELTVDSKTSGAGLSRDTKFNLREAVKLPFTEEWFGIAPGKPFGDHPKRGALNLQDLTMKRQLHAAVTEAKEAGAFDVLDLTRKTKRKPSPSHAVEKSRARRVR
jgi:mRNA-degrading endonuclease toxin of MazEF toxin-antitoxin module